MEVSLASYHKFQQQWKQRKKNPLEPLTQLKTSPQAMLQFNSQSTVYCEAHIPYITWDQFYS